MNTKFLYKTLIATFVTVAFFAPVKAQVIHSVGGTIPLCIRTYTVYADTKNTDAYYLVMLSYGFRVNLSETDNSSFSVGPLFSAGGGIYSDSYGSGFLYSGDLQAWVDFNSGLGAVQDSPKNTGFYLGDRKSVV